MPALNSAQAEYRGKFPRHFACDHIAIVCRIAPGQLWRPVEFRQAHVYKQAEDVKWLPGTQLLALKQVTRG